jgi:hypothetical protein
MDCQAPITQLLRICPFCKYIHRLGIEDFSLWSNWWVGLLLMHEFKHGWDIGNSYSWILKFEKSELLLSWERKRARESALSIPMLGCRYILKRSAGTLLKNNALNAENIWCFLYVNFQILGQNNRLQGWQWEKVIENKCDKILACHTNVIFP